MQDGVLVWSWCLVLPWALATGYSIDNFVRPFWAHMVSQRDYEDAHIYSTSTRHYGTTWVHLHEGYTLTYQPPPSTMEISFPTILVDEAWMNASCSMHDSGELFAQYKQFRRKFTLPDNLIPQTTVGDMILASGMESGSIRDNIRLLLDRRYWRRSTTREAVTPVVVVHDEYYSTPKQRKKRGRKTTHGTKKVMSKRKRMGRKQDGDYRDGDDNDQYDGEEEVEEDEMEKMAHLSAMDTEELLREEKKMRTEKEESTKRNVNIELRDYDETNKTGLKYKHKEYVKKGYYYKDESAQYIRGSREYMPKIVSNHSNLNRFIEKIQQQPRDKKGVKTGYKYRKERFQQSGFDYRDEAGKFYRKNIEDSRDVKNYDVGFRFKDTIVNNSLGKMKAIHRYREGTQFKKGFGDAKDYEHKFQHEYENYQDSRSQYKRKQEVHKVEKKVSRKFENQRVRYEMKNEQRVRPNGSQVNIDHFDYDKVERGNMIKRRKPVVDRRYIPHELAGGGFSYINQDLVDRHQNQSYVLRHQRGRVKILNNGSVEWITQRGDDRRNTTAVLNSGLLPAPARLDSNELVPDVSNIGSQISDNETGFQLRDEAFEVAAGRNYKYNKSLGRFYSKLGPPSGGYRDIVFKYLDTRHRDQEEGYRKSDRRGHIITREKVSNVSSENKKAYNLVHEKVVQPNIKMINEKGYIHEMNNYEDYFEKTFTHYLKQYKSKQLKYTQQYNQIVNMNKRVLNNTKLNISYSKLMRKSHDRVQCRAPNETWSMPWHDQLYYTMAPEMNYVPLLGTMEPQADFLPESEQTESPRTTSKKLFLLEKTLKNFNRSAGYTYEEDSDYQETIDPNLLDSKGHWIYPNTDDVSTVASMSSAEIASIARSFNGTRENREFNYVDWQTFEMTDEPRTTHICQMIYNPNENRMEFCKHPSHQLTCRECNKTFKGWFEYNLHQQAVNRKFKKYFFEEKGLFNDMVTYQFVNGTLRPGLENVIQRARGPKRRKAGTGHLNFIPYENFNPLHFDDPRQRDSFKDYSRETRFSDASEGDLYDGTRNSEDEITRPDFAFMYRRNKSAESAVAYQNYSDSESRDEGISVMKLAHAHLYTNLLY